MQDKFNPQDAEPRLYAMWENAGAFKPKMDSSLEAYSIVIPPPNVTGSLHMGHAVNNTLQDILIRFERMRGKDVLWQPGTDHAGIATQMVVERKLDAAGGKTRKDMTREEFLEKVWDWKKESGGNISQQLRRLGASCDWSREKFTLGNPEDPSDKMAEAVTKAFVVMYDAGLIYRDKRLVNWDPHFQTAISDLEVENREKDGHFWHFKYPLDGGETYEYVEKDEDGNVTLRETRDYISIATTRPETMLGDGAVAVHPDDERYAPIVGKMVRLPLANRLIPIITDEYPDPEFGSGAVKITGAHDFNDYDVAKRNDIPMYSLMDERGHMCESEIMPAKYVGMDRFKARKEVVKDIDAEGLLIAVEDKKVMQPFGDRSNVVIEPMLTDQWYVDAKSLAGDAIAAVNRGHSAPTPSAHPREGGDPVETDGENWIPSSEGKSGVKGSAQSGDKGSTRFIPESWKKTYDNWMNDIQPWCISRQLWWGHRIPAWFGPKIEGLPENTPENSASNIFVSNSDVGALQKAKAFYAPHGYKVAIVDYPVKAMASGMNNTVYIYQDPDVLDTWFSSGLWPFSTLGWPDETDELARFYPGAVLVTAFDIIFFWVARMMMQGLHFRGEVPFKDVYIHAIVRDENGKKMSKSEGNVIDPVDLIDGIDIDTLVKKRTTGLRRPETAPKVEKATRKSYPDGFEAYGADALRFTLAAMAAAGRDIKLSVKRVEGYRNFGTKLWNAARFGQMNEVKSDVEFNPGNVTLGYNLWIVTKAVETRKAIEDHIEHYRFDAAADAIYKFAWGTFCDWYLELIKPVLSGENTENKDETQQTFGWVFDQILKMLHPFMPFITEELWRQTAERDGEMLILAQWPNTPLPDNGYSAWKDVEQVKDLISAIRSVRAEMNIPPSKKADLLMIGGNEDVLTDIRAYGEALERMARVSEIKQATAAPNNALQTVVGGVTYAIPLEGLIDLDAERARLAKEIEKTDAEIEKIVKKLGNANFVERAPEAVVAEQHTRKAAFESEKEKLQEALAGLG